MYKHIKNKLIHSIYRLISSQEITPITTRGPTEVAPLGYLSYIMKGTLNM